MLPEVKISSHGWDNGSRIGHWRVTCWVHKGFSYCNQRCYQWTTKDSKWLFHIFIFHSQTYGLKMDVLDVVNQHSHSILNFSSTQGWWKKPHKMKSYGGGHLCVQRGWWWDKHRQRWITTKIKRLRKRIKLDPILEQNMKENMEKNHQDKAKKIARKFWDGMRLQTQKPSSYYHS